MQIEHGPTIGEWIRSAAERFGDREFVVLHSGQGEQRLSYADAEKRSNEIARGMLASGIGKGTRVGLLLPNGPDWVLAWLAANRIGALAVPICTFYRAQELAWTLRHSDIHVLLTARTILGNDFLARLEEAAPEIVDQTQTPLRIPSLPYLREVRVWGEADRAWALDGRTGYQALAARHPEIDDAFLREVESCVVAADWAALIHTSGSTADPKGVVHSQGTLVRHAYAVNERRGLLPDDRLYTPMPFFWLGGFHTGVLSVMTVGACLLCDERFEPSATLDMLERERASVVLGWPYHGKALRDEPSFSSRDMSCLRAGGRNALPPPGAEIEDSELRPNWLGMTEAFGPHCSGQMDRPLDEATRGSFGTPVSTFEHRIIDPETGDERAAGEAGEICIRGGSLMQQLYKAERADTFDADGFYHTGDGGYFDGSGNLYFTGRLGETIKTAGANVSPREVEVALEAFDAVKEAYVVGLSDADRGEIVAAAVVAHAGQSIDTERLRQQVKANLSAFKVPKLIEVFEKSELPETSTGKIRKDPLREAIEARRAEPRN